MGTPVWRRPATSPAQTTRTTICTRGRSGQVFTQTNFREPALSSVSQAGLVNNLNDGLAWGLFPILFATAGPVRGQDRGPRRALPDGVGCRQLFTGALSDRWGRKWFIAAGMWVQAVALGVVALADSFPLWAGAAVLLGAGTAIWTVAAHTALSDLVVAVRMYETHHRPTVAVDAE